jgi:uncharacterized protein (DUF1697 family)
MIMLQEAPTEIRSGMSMEDFIEQFHHAPFELINDHRRLLMPTVPRHNLAVDFVRKLLDALTDHASIVVFAEVPFVLTTRVTG